MCIALCHAYSIADCHMIIFAVAQAASATPIGVRTSGLRADHPLRCASHVAPAKSALSARLMVAKCP